MLNIQSILYQYKNILILPLLILLNGCFPYQKEMFNDIKNGGPTLSDIEIAVDQSAENEIHNGKRYKYNSLWKDDASILFQNNRPGKVGDVIKVKVEIKDKAKLENETIQSRSSKDKLPMPDILGTAKPLQDKFNTPDLLSMSSNKSTYGNGEIDRKEDIQTEVGVTVTKVLTNGNLIVKGSQEVLVNTELRQIRIDGIIRPEDISMDNTIEANKIAELRIYYGGKGIISSMQRPRVGVQILDTFSPL